MSTLLFASLSNPIAVTFHWLDPENPPLQGLFGSPSDLIPRPQAVRTQLLSEIRRSRLLNTYLNCASQGSVTAKATTFFDILASFAADDIRFGQFEAGCKRTDPPSSRLSPFFGPRDWFLQLQFPLYCNRISTSPQQAYAPNTGRC